MFLEENGPQPNQPIEKRQAPKGPKRWGWIDKVPQLNAQDDDRLVDLTGSELDEVLEKAGLTERQRDKVTEILTAVQFEGKPAPQDNPMPVDIYASLPYKPRVGEIRAATEEELARVPGLSQRNAKILKQLFK